LFKRLTPIFTVLLSVLLDTAVIPVLYNGVFQIPLSLIAIIAIGIQLGRMRGMLYGMIAGLLMDICTGNMGLKLFPYILIGFLIGFLLDQQPEPSRSMEKFERFRILVVRSVWIFVLVAIYEVVMLVYQYFNTAIFEWIFVRNLALRVLMVVALCLLLHNFFKRIFIGKNKQADKSKAYREVKHF